MGWLAPVSYFSCLFLLRSSRRITGKRSVPPVSNFVTFILLRLECKGYRVRSRWSRYLFMWCYTLLMLSKEILYCCRSHILMWFKCADAHLFDTHRLFFFVIMDAITNGFSFEILVWQNVYCVSTIGLFSQFKRLHVHIYVQFYNVLTKRFTYIYVYTFLDKGFSQWSYGILLFI